MRRMLRPLGIIFFGLLEAGTGVFLLVTGGDPVLAWSLVLSGIILTAYLYFGSKSDDFGETEPGECES
jgi:hypothetical protein